MTDDGRTRPDQRWDPGALSLAADRYRRGGVSTSGLVRAVGHALAS